MTRKLNRADYAIKEAEEKLARIRTELERQQAAVRAEAAAARRELERLRTDAERLEKSTQAELAAAKSDRDRMQTETKKALDAKSKHVTDAQQRMRQLDAQQGARRKGGKAKVTPAESDIKPSFAEDICCSVLRNGRGSHRRDCELQHGEIAQGRNTSSGLEEHAV